ncbi:unnamed protein product [Rotaria sordida]|uniref:Uncharacterized protein n=1 Tax=Rotaria sordida TaxID=392033 RepID=A0A816BKW6_9BILA|nr:unnamed protein product [Rotaria sordida]CAF1612796.1 unnamed protein product [Rotaria sordida]
MFRFIALLCLVHVSFGTIIRGRVLVNGNANIVDTVPSGSRLIIRLEGTSIANASSMVIKQTEISNIVAFPFYYQIRISTNISSALSYSLSALIKKGDILVYVNEQPIPVKIGTESLITIDIPVMFIGENRALQPLLNNVQQSSWPELVGREGTYAVQYIKEKTGFTDVFIVLEGSLVTLDYRTDRVRVFVNTKGVVIQIPYIG